MCLDQRLIVLKKAENSTTQRTALVQLTKLHSLRMLSVLIWWINMPSKVALFQGYIDLKLRTAWLTELPTVESSGGPATPKERHRRQDKTRQENRRKTLTLWVAVGCEGIARLRLFPSPRRLFKCQASKSGKGLDRNKITSWWDDMTTFPLNRK